MFRDDSAPPHAACDVRRHTREITLSRRAGLVAIVLAGAGLLLLPAPLAGAERGSGVVSRIRHHPVESRALASVGYSTRLRALEITFKRGGTYRYLDVPRSVYDDLLAAESKAGFYNRNVRGKYRSVYVRAKKSEVAKPSG